MLIVLRLPMIFIRLFLQSAWLALGQIWINKARSVLTAIGIIIGVASVTTVIAALTGLKEHVLAEFEAFGTNKMYIFPKHPEEGPLKHASWDLIKFMPEQFDDMLAHCPSVKTFTRVTQFDAPVQAGDRTIDSVRVLGIEEPWHDIENRSVELGGAFSVVAHDLGKPVCLLPTAVRDRLHLDRDCTGQSVLLDRRRFHVQGVVEKQFKGEALQGVGDEAAEVVVPFSTAWKMRQAGVWLIAAIRSPEVAEEAQAEVRFYLRRVKGLGPGDADTFGIEVMQKYIQEFQTVAMAITAVAGGIVGISLLVGGVGIMNIMLVSVSERTREIGLRKAVGARPSAILLQFLVEAVMLCFFGGALGVLAGQGLTKLLASIPGAELQHAAIPLWAIALSFGFAAAVGVFFGMFPAVKAARLDPIEALRHE
jgi:putative ABC transport system permease protein